MPIRPCTDPSPLRWHHAERGTIPPAEFIPVAEEIGLIVPLGEWLLRKACADATRWPDEVKLAVNLSPNQIMNQNLLPMVVNALAASGLPAHRLELEITEAVLMQNSEQTLGTLHQLRGLGIHISMDDFGTGYSSLSYLRSFPFDKIKIDRCFHLRALRERRVGGNRARGRSAREQPEHAHDGRGCRNAPANAASAGARLHRDAGLSIQQAAAARRGDQAAGSAHRA